MEDLDWTAILEDLARPLLEATPDPAQRGVWLQMAATCWNLAILPPTEVESRFLEIAEQLRRTDPLQLARFAQAYGILMERKARLYPDLLTPLSGFRLKTQSSLGCAETLPPSASVFDQQQTALDDIF